LSAEVREQLQQVRHTADGWLGVMERLQRRVAAEFGLEESVGLEVMRCAEQLLPGDREVREISLYRKYNRCVDGQLRVGDLVPDAELHQLDGSTVSLLQLLCESSKPCMVVFGGSYS